MITCPLRRLPALVRGWPGRSRSRPRPKVRVAIVAAALFALALAGASAAGSAARPPPRAPTAGPRRRCPAPCSRRTTTPAGRASAYNVTSVNGTANSYRSDGVDLEATTDTGGPANDLGWTAAGQWFKYTVNVATAGTYTVGLRLASPSAVTDGLHIANSAGTNLSGNVNVPATGGYQTWATVIATVTLPAGTQTLTVDQDNAGWNINFLAFGLNTSGGGNRPRPAKPRTAAPRRRCPAPCRRRTTTPAGRAWPTTSPRSTAPPTATAPTGSTWRPPPTAAAATTWAGPRPGSGSSTPSTSPRPAPTR